MKVVITYGTYDLLHYGHIRLLERAKALGDYLIVGVTGDDFDKARGKINSKQSLIERVEAVEKLGIADKVIVEEYAGQKIDDIKKYNVNIFAIGSDWYGKFDYLKEYCEVVYLDRTQGISSSQIRSEGNIQLSFIGDNKVLSKFYNESGFVNSIEKKYIYTSNKKYLSTVIEKPIYNDNLDDVITTSDSLYVLGNVDTHYDVIKKCLSNSKNVLCESPITKSISEFDELVNLAHEKNVLLMDSIKTAYSLAYHRLVLLVKSGIIGEVVSIDATCTSMRSSSDKAIMEENWTSILKWGPTSLLPVFDILGIDYNRKSIVTSYASDNRSDKFTSISFIYDHAIANVKVGKGVKSEGNLVISGTKGCVYVEAPWWKTDYFEIHYENPEENKKYFYQLDGEGIRNELVQFASNVKDKTNFTNVDLKVSRKIVEVIEDFYNGKDVTVIKF